MICLYFPGILLTKDRELKSSNTMVVGSDRFKLRLFFCLLRVLLLLQTMFIMTADFLNSGSFSYAFLNLINDVMKAIQ